MSLTHPIQNISKHCLAWFATLAWASVLMVAYGRDEVVNETPGFRAGNKLIASAKGLTDEEAGITNRYPLSGTVLFTNTYAGLGALPATGSNSSKNPKQLKVPGGKTNDVVNDPLAFWELFRTNQPAAQALLDKEKQNMEAALASATNTIPYAADFARLFPGAFNSFSYYTGVAGPSSFNMEVLLFDRYKLLMKVPVTFEEDRRKVKSFGNPEFQIMEISRVTKRTKEGGGPDGKPVVAENLLVGQNGDAMRKFGADEWKKVVRASGDFSVIGFPLKTNSPAPGFEDLRKDWEMRRRSPSLAR